jgi:perosamine synthetase
MAELERKLRNILPTTPRRRYNIYTGSNTKKEWNSILRYFLSNGQDIEQEEQIEAYETLFAQSVGTQHAVSFGAGRMALYAILEALGIGPGHEVILPAFTCAVVPNAIIYRGARPVYVDIEPHSFNIDVSRIEAAISSRTRALYAQHTFGVPCEVEVLRAIGSRHGLPVIEDGAHGLGATVNSQPVGSLTEVAYFSTDHSKMVGTHLGGMATTNDPSLARKIRSIQRRSPFLPWRVQRRLLRSFLIEYILYSPSVYWLGKPILAPLLKLGLMFYFLDELMTTMPKDYPYPCRLSAPQAWLGYSQLRLLPANLAHRRSLARWLESELGWYGMDDATFSQCSWLRYSFLVRDREAFERRFRRRFDLGIWFTSIAEGRVQNLEAISYQTGSCPVAEQVCRHIVNFPTHARIPLRILQEEFMKHARWVAGQIVSPKALL